MQRTFTIIKPDAVAAGHTGAMLAHLEREGFRIVALRKIHLSRAQAEGFYAVHSARPFFGSLVDFMTSGPCVPAVLERADAVPYLREVMGATDVAKAADGTIRKLFGTSIEANAIHGSDSPENAVNEIAFFFSESELLAAL